MSDGGTGGLGGRGGTNEAETVPADVDLFNRHLELCLRWEGVSG